MKHLYVLLLLSLSIACIKVTAKNKRNGYTASNGKTYTIGDTVVLGMGSMPNGDFKWLVEGGWGAMLSYDYEKGSDQFNSNKNYAGTNVIIKSINSYKAKGATKVYFSVGIGNITNYYLYIEEAIISCEIRDCANKHIASTTINNIVNPGSVADELAKLKKLKSEGILTEEEYQKQKDKLLNK